MRKSNIVLSGMFIGTVIMMTVLQTSVYKKAMANEIEDGTFYRNKNEREKYSAMQIKPFTSIKMDSLYDVWIGYDTVYKVLVENNEKEKVVIKQEGSELTITGEKKDEDMQLALRYNGVYGGNKKVIIYCPDFSSIKLAYGRVEIGDFSKANIAKMNLMANNAGFFISNFREKRQGNSKAITFNELQIELNGFSTFEVFDNFLAKKISLNANGTSKVRFRNLMPIDSLKMKICDSCSIEMPGEFLKKMKN